MKVKLPYGKSHLVAEIPDQNLMKVGYTSQLEDMQNVNSRIRESLKRPIGTPPLSTLIGAGDQVCIIVDDYTRPTPSEILLPPILGELRDNGVNEEDIDIVVACGLHPAIPERLEEIVGKEIFEEYRCVYHRADESEMTTLGETSRGIPIKVNTLVEQADFKISTGLIEPHLFAGFTGGRKLIMPGVSSREGIYGNHGYKMLENDNARPGILEGNPVHEDCVEHAKRVNHDFIVNVILNSNKKIGKIVAGDFIQAHRKGVEMDRRIVGVEFPEKADITITTNNGSPLDLDLYQTVKGMYTASTITKKGGSIITVSQCSDGVGPESWWETHRKADSPEEVYEIIRENEPIECQWENQMLAKIQEVQDIYLISEVEDRVVEDFMITPTESIEQAVQQAFRKQGSDAQIIVLPEGPVILPVIG